MLVVILAEEREDLEVIHNLRQKQLELQHHHLLQELEQLKVARETTTLSKSMVNLSPTGHSTLTTYGQDQPFIIESNFQNLT